MIIAIDPGDHIGCVWVTQGETVYGKTLETDERLQQLWELLHALKPDVIIYEEFALRQSAASHLVGNKFITCEVIGVIKLYCQLTSTPMIKLTPSCKEYCGFSDSARDPAFKVINCMEQKITEHVRDAYRLLRYAILFKLKELNRGSKIT